MRRDWGELDARARGLATRLLDRPALERLAGLGTPAAVARELARQGRVPGAEGAAATPPALDRELRRGAAGRFRQLERRAGRRRRALEIVFGREDVRSLRRLLRGARASAPPEERRAGLLPTPGLPEERLERLSRAEDVDDLVRRLDDQGHALGPPLVAALAAYGTDLPALETALLAAHLERARRGISRSDGRLRAHVALTADLANAWSCLLATQGDDAGSGFLEGGRRIDRDVHTDLAGEEDPERRRRAVGEALGIPGPGRPVADPTIPLAELEGRILGVRLAEERSAARRDPLSAAPLLHFVFAQRAELADLRRILWGLALGAPAAVVRKGLVTP